MSPDLLPAKYAARIRVEESGCWEWTGTIRTRDGYGCAYWAGRNWGAHQVIYRILVGSPGDKVLDHTCHSNSDCLGGRSCPHRRCVNPLHLEAVTARVNARRMQKKMCRSGRHEMSPENVQVRRGLTGELTHFCKRCCRDRERERRRERSAEAIQHTVDVPVQMVRVSA